MDFINTWKGEHLMTGRGDGAYTKDQFPGFHPKREHQNTPKPEHSRS
jgi:hypothetical protein